MIVQRKSEFIYCPKLQQANIARIKRKNARLEEEMAFLKIAAYFVSISYARIKAN